VKDMHNNKKKVNKIDSNPVNKKKEFANYFVFILIILPLFLFILLGFLGLNLEPYIMSSLVKFFIYISSIFYIWLIFIFVKLVGLENKANFRQVIVMVLSLGLGLAVTFATPIASAFSSLYIQNSHHFLFEDNYVVTEKRFTPRYRQYAVESIANHASYTFLMHSRFGNQNDLYPGVTVKLKGIENSWGRVVTSYEVIDSPPIKN
jgi:hypothetical protein